MSTEQVSDDVPEEPTSSSSDQAGSTTPEEAAQEAAGGPETPRPFHDREKAREAGRLGGEATKRGRDEAREMARLAEAAGREGAAQGAVAAMARRASAADAEVVRALEKAAAKGDVQAARALLDWRRLDATQGAGLEASGLAQYIAQLETRQQAALRSMLIELLEQWESGKEAA